MFRYSFMKKLILFFSFFLLEYLLYAQCLPSCLFNEPPLVKQKFTTLPLGSIKPKGMLEEMLKRQKEGLTGKLDSVYSLVCGDNNGWLGGVGDGWERAPYWLDGLLPLAYILNDDLLKAKVQKWIEWSIDNQCSSGYFGPLPLAEGYQVIPGTQQYLREDWWPKMVMLKVLQQYYMATGDKRVVNLMSRYFKYMYKELKDRPLGFYTYWGNARGADNLSVVLWLYNITKESFLLDLGELIHSQTYDWASAFTNNTLRRLNPVGALHCVNVAMGLKAPAVYYQLRQDTALIESIKEGLNALKDVHGYVNGMYGGDEALHGNNPTQGIELCSVVEMMYSLETILSITGDTYYADYLEKLAYNVLPTQHTDDFMGKQYFQQVNQVIITDQPRNFFNDYNGRIVYGTTTGYPCCLCNMHQGWPKFIQNLWYSTPDLGLAALIYGASEVRAKVAGGNFVTIKEKTDYPFDGTVSFIYETNKNVSFPLYLRVPQWCNEPILYINGIKTDVNTDEGMLIINREWKYKDNITIEFPMDIKLSRWFENSIGIERGPLVYGLKIGEEWRLCKKEIGALGTEGYEHPFWEVYPTTPWNYGLSNNISVNDFEVIKNNTSLTMPWNIENAPITLKTKAKRIPVWRIENNSAGMIPSYTEPSRCSGIKEELIELIPYGCTTLRIAQFPAY